MTTVDLPDLTESTLRDLNPWWSDPAAFASRLVPYQRRLTTEIRERLLSRPTGLIESVRGPRQVGKTTGIHQIIADLLKAGVDSTDILFVRFDLEALRLPPSALVSILKWYAGTVRGRPLTDGTPPFVFLDEVHKLSKWDEQVKHVVDTFGVRTTLTGSSSVLVARGGRESLAGRVFSSEMPPFSFREFLEAWHPDRAEQLPARLRFGDALDRKVLLRSFTDINGCQSGQKKVALNRRLERYFNRGGYPRLHNGEVADDVWADYLYQTIFENVLGSDIPDLFPVGDPGLLKSVAFNIARFTGTNISQTKLAELAKAQGYSASRPTVGTYIGYLCDALLVRQFPRYPLAKRRSSTSPAKLTLTDLGIRNAIFRGAPSLWESAPSVLGPLVETVAQSVIRDVGVSVHYWNGYAEQSNRKSPLREVDFVAEYPDGSSLPIEIKFRKQIRGEDKYGLLSFFDHFPATEFGLLVTRDQFEWDRKHRILSVPLLTFLLTF